jgi:hypothetical protein
VHEGEEDPQLALVTGRVLAVFEPEVEVEALGDLLHPRLVETTVQRAVMAGDVATAQAAELRQLSGYVTNQALDLDRLPHAVEAENRADPAVAWMKAMSRRMVVLLPAPFGPR